MTDASPTRRTGDLLSDLVADLKPVRRVGSPWLRALVWSAFVVAVALCLASFAKMPAVERRLTSVPDMWLAVLGSTLTALLAGCATFQLGMPDRSPLWSLLPLPGVVLWISASSMGCARGWLTPGTTEISMAETGHCMMFIIGLSVPLSVVIFLMLRRGYSLYPTVTGGTAGLAVAAAAATLLNFFHPYDAALDDLLVHAAAVVLVIGLNRLLGGFLFGARRHRPRKSDETNQNVQERPSA